MNNGLSDQFKDNFRLYKLIETYWKKNPKKTIFAVIFLIFSLSLPFLLKSVASSTVLGTRETSIQHVSQSANQNDTNNQTVNIEINNGQSTSTVNPTVSMPTPKIDNNQCNTDFPGKNWDTKFYYSNITHSSTIYEPRPVDYFYPPITYINKVSALIKKFYLQYSASYQNIMSSESAALHFAMIEGDQELFEINIPAFNRQIIEIKVKNDNDPLPTVVPVKSEILKHKISPIGTHEINITTKEPVTNNGKIIYIFEGNFVYAGGVEKVTREIPVTLLTTDPSEKDFTFEIGTGKTGKLNVKNFSICDQ